MQGMWLSRRLYTLVLAATNFIFTWVNLVLVDRIGRRRILLCTMWGMAVALVCAAVCFHWIPISTREMSWCFLHR